MTSKTVEILQSASVHLNNYMINGLEKLSAQMENLENVISIYCFYQTMSEILKTY